MITPRIPVTDLDRRRYVWVAKQYKGRAERHSRKWQALTHSEIPGAVRYVCAGNTQKECWRKIETGAYDWEIADVKIRLEGLEGFVSTVEAVQKW